MAAQSCGPKIPFHLIFLCRGWKGPAGEGKGEGEKRGNSRLDWGVEEGNEVYWTVKAQALVRRIPRGRISTDWVQTGIPAVQGGT